MKHRFTSALLGVVLGCGCASEAPEPAETAPASNAPASAPAVPQLSAALERALAMTQVVADVTVLDRRVRKGALTHALPGDVIEYDAAETRVEAHEVLFESLDGGNATVVDMDTECGTFRASRARSLECGHGGEGPGRVGSGYQLGTRYVVLLGYRPAGVGDYAEETLFTMMRLPVLPDGRVDLSTAGIAEPVPMETVRAMLGTPRP